MDYAKKNFQISNSYYNLGLEKAKIRDLTGAAYCLKKSLHFHKYHTQSRNLLGLVYCEVGEVADALLQWVISLNLQPKGNDADRYIDEIQRKSGRLEVLGISIKKYNQALLHAKQGSEDLAILQLTRSIEENPNYIKAHLLLATLYILHEEYGKARKSIAHVLRIDQHNPRAMSYMTELKPGSLRTESENKVNYVLSHRQMQDDDIIIPSTYRETTGWQSVINIMVGLALGAAVVYFLVMPANTKAVNRTHNNEMLVFYENLSQKNIKVEQLSVQINQLQEQYDAAQQQVQNIEDDGGYILKHYQILVQMLDHYRKDEFQQAVLLYTDWDISVITDDPSLAIAQQIDADMKKNGYQVLETLGNRARDQGNTEQALDYYGKSLLIKGDNAQVIFQIGVIYKRLDQKDLANDMFGQVIMNFPNTPIAAKAKEERGY